MGYYFAGAELAKRLFLGQVTRQDKMHSNVIKRKLGHKKIN